MVIKILDWSNTCAKITWCPNRPVEDILNGEEALPKTKEDKLFLHSFMRWASRSSSLQFFSATPQRKVLCSTCHGMREEIGSCLSMKTKQSKAKSRCPINPSFVFIFISFFLMLQPGPKWTGALTFLSWVGEFSMILVVHLGHASCKWPLFLRSNSVCPFLQLWNHYTIHSFGSIHLILHHHNWSLWCLYGRL